MSLFFISDAWKAVKDKAEVKSKQVFNRGREKGLHLIIPLGGQISTNE